MSIIFKRPLKNDLIYLVMINLHMISITLIFQNFPFEKTSLHRKDKRKMLFWHWRAGGGTGVGTKGVYTRARDHGRFYSSYARFSFSYIQSQDFQVSCLSVLSMYRYYFESHCEIFLLWF